MPPMKSSFTLAAPAPRLSSASFPRPDFAPQSRPRDSASSVFTATIIRNSASCRRRSGRYPWPRAEAVRPKRGCGARHRRTLARCPPGTQARWRKLVVSRRPQAWILQIEPRPRIGYIWGNAAIWSMASAARFVFLEGLQIFRWSIGEDDSHKPFCLSRETSGVAQSKNSTR